MPLLWLSECLLRNRQTISFKRKSPRKWASTGVEKFAEKPYKEGILSQVSQHN